MFEIGSSLRAARMRQELELSQAEHDTRIRAKYLRALEDERFDVLPGAAYTKGFLRTYADYLGLDAQPFVDEYNTRFASEEEEAPPPQLKIRHRRRFALAPWLLVVAALAASIAALAWGLSGKGGGHHAGPPPSTTQRRTTTRAALPAAPRTSTQPKPVARIALVARRGRCWLSIHLGSATGKLVYERTLEQGRTARFVSPRLWIRIGAPWNLDATLNGKAVQLPASTGDVVVTPTGLRATA
jgi:cytoskeleton protein RodZ